MKIKDCGVIEYGAAWALQRDYFAQVLAAAEQVLMLCEHPHVYTLGRSGHENNLLVDDAFLAKIGATYFKTDRGGDITYHGPGQLVGYPILDLARQGMGVKEYVNSLEQAVIDTVGEWGIVAGRLEGATGVWICDDRGERKICAIGVRASHFVTMHGFALNVSTDLSYFNFINPCGFVDKGVTSMLAEGVKCDMQEVKRVFVEKFCRDKK